MWWFAKHPTTPTPTVGQEAVELIWLCIFLRWWYKNIFRGGQYQLKCDRCGNIFKSKMNWRFILLSCIPKCDQCGTISPLTKLNFALPHFQNRPLPFLICQNLKIKMRWFHIGHTLGRNLTIWIFNSFLTWICCHIGHTLIDIFLLEKWWWIELKSLTYHMLYIIYSKS